MQCRRRRHGRNRRVLTKIWDLPRFFFLAFLCNKVLIALNNKWSVRLLSASALYRACLTLKARFTSLSPWGGGGVAIPQYQSYVYRNTLLNCCCWGRWMAHYTATRVWVGAVSENKGVGRWCFSIHVECSSGELCKWYRTQRSFFASPLFDRWDQKEKNSSIPPPQSHVS